jgi:hypothetical protein
MSNTITPTVFYRTLNVEGLEIFYREAGHSKRGLSEGAQVNSKELAGQGRVCVTVWANPTNRETSTFHLARAKRLPPKRLG